ncbi:MAG: S1 family peptidase [Labilithrix sp.]|nr:S1 family peptidase [Labilithrix sp.]MCW5813552.1 S1 family peptidase [Labilithrix sp.]
MLSTTTTRLFAALLVSSVGAAVTGCAVEPDQGGVSEPSVGTVIQPIIRGGGSGTEHDSVVVLTTIENGQRAALCTGTLVAPNLVLTARHCVSNTDATTACAQDGTPISGSMIRGNRVASHLAVFVGTNGVAPDSAVEANAAARGKRIIVDASDTVCNHDIALVMLDRELTSPVAPLRMTAPAATEKVDVVGWGVNESGSLVAARSARRDIPLLGVGPGPYPTNPAWGYGDAEFMTGESACAGDSGAPAFAKGGAVIGVSARAGNGQPSNGNMASTCVGGNAHAVYTHISKFEKLIKAAFDVAKQPLWLEGQVNPWAPLPASDGSSGSSGIMNQGGNEPTPGAQQHSAKADLLGDTSAADDDGEPATGAPAAADDSAAGGCSMSNEPPSDNVAYAAGVVAVVALLFGLRRRFRKDAPPDELPPPRDPYESMM